MNSDEMEVIERGFRWIRKYVATHLVPPKEFMTYTMNDIVSLRVGYEMILDELEDMEEQLGMKGDYDGE